MGAQRADAFLVEKGYFPSRARARAAILAGDVLIDGLKVAKAGMPVREGSVVELVRHRRYVSKGGDKLEGALAAFCVDVRGLRVMDAGASTGGFTDCLLAHGAREVVAVDVGYGQFDWRLRNDERVTLLERTNIRHVTVETIGGRCDAAVADLSFISLRLVVPVLEDLVVPRGPLLVLFKPQFEVGKADVGKGGIVREPRLHVRALQDFAKWAERRGNGPLGLATSHPRGAGGNVEFWWHLAAGAPRLVDSKAIGRAVAEAGAGDASGAHGQAGV